MERREICPPFFCLPRMWLRSLGLETWVDHLRRSWNLLWVQLRLQKPRQMDLKGPSFHSKQRPSNRDSLDFAVWTWDMELGTLLRTRDSGLETSFFLDVTNGKQKIPARKASGSPPEALARSNDSMT